MYINNLLTQINLKNIILHKNVKDRHSKKHLCNILEPTNQFLILFIDTYKYSLNTKKSIIVKNIKNG